MTSQTTETASKRTVATIASNAASTSSKQTSSKMHRRSRTGCFTCRLRRKKCDEGKPACKACRHLGLRCDYKRPMWWSNSNLRSQQKEAIKNIIKRTKLTEKTVQIAGGPSMSASTPPSLCHSLPTETFSDSVRTRAGSEESEFCDDQDFSYVPQDYLDNTGMPPLKYTPCHPQFPPFTPYEVDIKTERQIYVNDIPTRRESSMSTFSTYQLPPPHAFLPCSFPADGLMREDYLEDRRESFAEEPVDFRFFDFPHVPITPSHEAMIHVEECDRYLLNHFIENVARLILPILEVNQHGSARSDVILPALESNKCYLHCCLSVSALHLKATECFDDEQVSNDIMRHRYAAISELCEALSRDENHLDILDATLGMIFFQCSVGRADDSLPDIAWHQHFQAVTSLIQKLDLPRQLIGSSANDAHASPPFNMTLTAWIDILGATMLGRTPYFADLYREKHLSGATAGLAELMGCEDRIMFLISEIACLEAIKNEGTVDDVTICAHISHLGEQINFTELQDDTVVDNAYSATGAIRPKQLRINMTSIFRLAARIYLASLVPGFDAESQTTQNMVAALTDAMDFIPAGAEGFDRSLVWPLLIAGSMSLPGSSFRAMMSERSVMLGESAELGSYGRVYELLRDLWQIKDGLHTDQERQSVHWRDVMRQKNWDFLLI